MHGDRRRQWLVERARTDGRLDVAQLSDELRMAPETIRRDLNQLERQGMLRRVYGGAVPADRMSFESGLAMRASRHPEEKQRIAAAAVAHIGNAEAIYLDEGILPQLVADRLHPAHQMMVVTGSLPIAILLSERPNIDVMVLGGRIRPKTLGCIDHWAINTLRSLVLDLAFIGGNGITFEHGVTVPDGAIAAVKTAAMLASRRRILIADSTKMGSDSLVSFAHLRDFERFITDTNLSDESALWVESAGVEVTRA
jgi:DeoR family fructose operon transcriptional repressor